MLLALVCVAAAVVFAEEAAPEPKESVLVLGKDSFEVCAMREIH